MNNFIISFRRIIGVILFALSFLLPVHPDGLDVQVTVENEPQQVITAEWTNNTGAKISEPRFYAEQKNGESWVQIDFAPAFGFEDIYTLYYPLESCIMNISTESVFGTVLPAGEYRIVLYYDVKSAATTADGSVCIPFTIA